MNRILQGDCLYFLKKFKPCSFDLIYADPPFNTGKAQTRGAIAYADSMDLYDYLRWIAACLRLARRALKPTGSILVHLDWHVVHTVKANIMDFLWGPECFINELIWAYDYGGRSKKWWPRKHDTILWYVMDPKSYTFNYAAIDRIPYLAPGLVGAEKAARGKTPTDCFWHTIVPTNGREKTGYPTQKPLGLINRLVLVHSNPGDRCLDFFAGSGTFGEACGVNDRRFVLIDENVQAIEIMKNRLERFSPVITVV